MSNATQASLFGADESQGGAARLHTKVKVIVHSHIEEEPPVNSNTAGVVNCSLDCISLSTNKTIKGGGAANFTLVPRHNYMNYIYPNDWVNIWINPGDGRGWIRVFFGFVDRVERSITSSDPGSTMTMFNVSCSDFLKAFDQTQVYFNPHIADRKDFIGNFAGTKNLAGAQLRTKGIAAFGGPADIALNFVHLLMGFGAQFMVPKSYPLKGALTEESRRWRREWAKSRLDSNVRDAIGKDTIKEWLDKIYLEAVPLAKKLKPMAALLRKEGKLSRTLQWQLDSTFSPQEKADLLNAFKVGGGLVNEVVLRVATGLLMEERGLKKNTAYDPEIKTGSAIEETSLGPGHLLDLIDFSFVEIAGIDGSIVSAPIWTQQGSLWSLMTSYSNDVVNELFMDLRPLGKQTKEYALMEGGYIREPDEHHSDKDEYGVRFVPAMIMREYPFSTIRGVNLGKVKILNSTGKHVTFGAIFSQEPNSPGRKVVSIPAVNDYLRIRDPLKKALKHLDVAVISIHDIISEQIGRSDADVVNLMEMYSDGFMGKHMKYSMQDVQPIAIPISVARHGLRVRTYTTRFARFSKKQSGKRAGDSFHTRNKLLRWIMLLDHWYQHNIEYLNGSMVTRGFPEIRVGYRLDVEERSESYYVEGVSHNWHYPDGMTTSFTLSRGQRNDPFPVYEKISLPAFGGNRKDHSRLADMFRQRDSSATVRSTSGAASFALALKDKKDGNLVDDPDATLWGDDEKSYLAANSDEPYLAEAVETEKKASNIPPWETLAQSGVVDQNSQSVLPTTERSLMESLNRIHKRQSGSRRRNRGSKSSGKKF